MVVRFSESRFRKVRFRPRVSFAYIDMCFSPQAIGFEARSSSGMHHLPLLLELKTIGRTFGLATRRARLLSFYSALLTTGTSCRKTYLFARLAIFAPPRLILWITHRVVRFCPSPSLLFLAHLWWLP